MKDIGNPDFLKKYNMLESGDTVLVAVSGGIDSMCLLDFLQNSAPRLRIKCAAAHYNHGLRGAESARDQEFVRSYCALRQIPFYTETGDVKASAKAERRGIEETAREMRYDFLRRAADLAGASKIATAHTADDNVETVLMNLARGTGINGLCGIPPVRGAVIRPLLTTSRARIEQYSAQRRIPFVEDSTNIEDIYTRNRIRHRIVPRLREINPGLGESVRGMTELLREDSAFLDEMSLDYFEKLDCSQGLFRVPAGELSALPRPVRSRVIKLILDALGASPGFKRLESVIGLLESRSPSGQLDLGRGVVASREYGDIIFSRKPAVKGAFEPVEIKICGSVLIPELGLKVKCGNCSEKINSSFNTFLFKTAAICGKISVRPREPGDKIALSGRVGTKSLKNLMIDAKIPRSSRDRIPVLADEAGVIAVYGFGVHRRCAAAGIDSDVIIITLEEMG